jgi:CubicO group peptidase (beta-lactamase class C family)
VTQHRSLVDDQQIVWQQGFGFADEVNKVTTKPETIYRAGSISKLFTATAVMQLVEKGKMDIDKPLTNYIPEFFIKSRFPHASPITSRTIMNHYSGLPGNFLKGMFTKNPEPYENVIGEIKNEYVACPPNYIFSYFNLGFALLGCALERAAGQSYASYMNDSVLPSLGMTHSLFSQFPSNSPLAAKAYRKGKEVEETPLRDIPAGGLNTSVLDLSRFIEMVFAEGRSGEHH